MHVRLAWADADLNDIPTPCMFGSQGAVWVVATKGRVAKVDGRSIHWVRGYGQADRYSLIFFATNPEHAVAPTASAFPDFVPAGLQPEND